MAANAALIVPNGAEAQEARSRYRVLAPPLAPLDGAPADFGRKVAERFRREIENLPRHAPFQGKELRDALRRYDVREEDLATEECVKGLQLAGVLEIPLVLCGSYWAGEGGMHVAASVISAQTGDRFEVEAFTSADANEAARRIVRAFEGYVQALGYTVFCRDEVGSESWATALEMCNTALAANPTGRTALYLKGTALWKLDSLESALAAFQKVIELDALHQDAYKAAGMIAMRLEKRELAHGYFREFLQLAPGDAGVRTAIAHEVAQAGDPEAALGIVEEGLTGDSIDSALYQYAGQLALAAGMKRSEGGCGADCDLPPAARVLFEKSYDYLRRVMEAEGVQADATIVSNMGVVLNKLERNQELIELAARVERESIDVDANFWIAHAEAVMASGDLSGALRALERALQKDPEASVHGRMAVWLIEGGRIEAAIEPAERAIRRGDIDPNVVARLIAVRGYRDKARGGEHDQAIDYYDVANRFAQDDATKAMVSFFHGYSLMHQAIAAQEPLTLESARRSLPMFQRARELVEAGAAYGGSASSREELLGNIDAYIEIQQALIKRGR